MSATIDRQAWPWHSAPADCEDFDAATWHASRAIGDGELPRQSLEEWVAEQRARRSRDVLEPEPVTEAEHEQLRVDLAAAWSDPLLDPAVIAARKPRWVNGALVGGVA
jgi:hypothetical protein